MSESTVLAEIKRLQDSINHHKATLAEGGAPRGSRGAYRGRGRGRGAPTHTHRNTTWVAPGRQLPSGVATPTDPLTSAQPLVPVQVPLSTPVPVSVPVGGFRNKTLILNQPNLAPSTSASADLSTPKRATPVAIQPGTEYIVDGVVFVSDARGNKLVRKPGALMPPSLVRLVSSDNLLLSAGTSLLVAGTPDSSTPRRTSVSGMQYIRTKSGNLVSLEFARKRKEAMEKGVLQDKKDRLDRLVGIVKGVQDARSDVRSTRGSARGRGRGRGLTCPYSHVHVSRDAPVCRAFVEIGWCEKGADCEERHVWECARFSSEGVCETKGCKLPHVLRRRNISGEEEAEEKREGQRVIVPSRKRSAEEESTGESADEGSEEEDVKGISAHATRRYKKGKRMLDSPDGDLSANADFVELFVPFSDSEDGLRNENDDEDAESVDSADLDGDEPDDDIASVDDEKEEDENEDFHVEQLLTRDTF
ncbi:hypothetical protein P7C70_g2717, partial [Phenoliferia sp. Uapishka_3]